MSDHVVIGGDEDLWIVGTGGVLDRLHQYVYAHILEEDSARAWCRRSDNVNIICDYIAVREKLRYTRIYPSIVRIGHGMRLYSIKEEDDLISEVSNRLDELRSSDKREDRAIAMRIGNVKIRFDGDRYKYRFEKTLVAQISECAKKCGANTSDLYLYYFLIGIKELVESEESLYQIAGFKEYKRSMDDLDDINEGLEISNVLINPLGAC